MRSAVAGRVAPPSSIAASLPAGLDDVLTRAMRPTPDDRFDSVSDFAAALEGLTEEARRERRLESILPTRDARRSQPALAHEQPSPSPFGSPRIRGTGLVPLLPFIDQTLGSQGRALLLSRLPRESAKEFETPFVATAWYPFSVALDAADALVAIGTPRLLRDLAAFSLNYATNLIFRAIFKIGSPSFMVARSDQVWRKYYSRGRMVSTAAKGRASVEVQDFPSLRPNYDRFIQYSIEAVLVKAHALNCIAKHPKCVLRGDPACVFEFKWQER
ncbi:MAG TPA: hypothetical protein VKU41_18165 [Polyangiaceae bacterium]|nr:hypothetical protein [Polyangiaceae bacterium]